MTSRSQPSKEYYRKLRNRHAMEWFCLIVAAIMFVLAAIFLLDIDRSQWIPEAIVVLGGVMNIVLAIRAALIRLWILMIALLMAGGVCFGLLAYIKWT